MLSLWWLVVPVLLALVLCALSWYMRREGLGKWIVATRVRRNSVTVALGLLIPSAIGWLLNSIGLDALFDGKLALRGLLFLVVAVLVLVCGIFVQLALTDAAQANEDEERRLHLELQAAQQLAKNEHLWRERAEADTRDTVAISDMFLQMIGAKAARFTGSEKIGKQAAASLQRVLQPDAMVATLCSGVHQFYLGRLRQHDARARLRIALFRLDNKYYAPIFSWDGHKQHCITSPTGRHKERFCIGGDLGCLLVHAAREGRLQVVSNCEDADHDEHHPFWFFDVNQRAAIKSIMVWPLTGPGENANCRYLLTLDTNVLDGFGNSDRDLHEAEWISSHLSQRLLYELKWRRLLHGQDL